MKNTSITALAVAAGMLLSMGSALAADLGGNCCADLEERVAELEATSAKKGTRKQSLEIWGNVNRTILSFDDGVARNTYLGIDNTNYASRVGFRGNAKIGAEYTAGYSFMFDVASGGRTSTVNAQRSATGLSGVSGLLADDVGVRVRDSNVWIESTRLGRATIGRLTADGVQGTIDLAGIGFGAGGGSASLIGGSMKFRGNANPNTPIGYGLNLATIANTTDQNGDYGPRLNGIKWSSPTLAGFQVSATIGGELSRDLTPADSGNSTIGTSTKLGLTYTAALKYAGEFNGVRLAAAVGYENSDSTDAPFGAAAAASLAARPISENVGGSLSLMHVATGLFAQGHYNNYKRGHDDGTSDSAKQFLVQAGISRNWFGIGNTSFYGEYQKTDNGLNTFASENGQGTLLNIAGGALFTGASKESMWGLGLSQKIDAASAELYTGYRNHSLSGSFCDSVAGCKDIGLFYSGMRISF